MGSTRIGTRWLGTLIVAAAVMTACSDSSTAPTSVANKLSDVASFELGLGTGGINNNNTPVAGQFKVCKTGDEPGAFVFSAVADPGGFGPAHAVAAGHSITNGTCEVVAEDNGGNGQGSNVTLQETPSPDLTGTTCTFQSFPVGAPTSCTYDNAGTAASRTFFLNSFHAYVITFNNVAPAPPPAVCDFITFGRLVTTVNGKKVVISGNAGGNQPGGGILAEFHVEVNGVDNHVANVDTYGPITDPTNPLFGLTNSRITTGTAKNGNFVELSLWDGGEPGKGTDRVYVKINGVVVVNQFIDQGNMQFHDNCRGPKN